MTTGGFKDKVNEKLKRILKAENNNYIMKTS